MTILMYLQIRFPSFVTLVLRMTLQRIHMFRGNNVLYSKNSSASCDREVITASEDGEKTAAASSFNN